MLSACYDAAIDCFMCNFAGGVVSRVYWHFVRIFFMGLLGGVHYAATVGLSY